MAIENFKGETLGAAACGGTSPITAEYRKQRPVFSGVLAYFPDALLEVANVSYKGNEQHNPGEPLHWAKGKSGDHSDALVRHLLDHGKRDTDGMRHSAKVAWRALALLQEEIENERKGETRAAVAEANHAAFKRSITLTQGEYEAASPQAPQTEAQYRAMPYGGQPLPAGGCSQEPDPNGVCCNQPAQCMSSRPCKIRDHHRADERYKHYQEMTGKYPGPKERYDLNYRGRTENTIADKNRQYEMGQQEKAHEERKAIEKTLISEMRTHGFGHLLREDL